MKKSYLVYVVEEVRGMEFPAETLVRCHPDELADKLSIIEREWRMDDTVSRMWVREIPDEHFDFLTLHDYMSEFDFNLETDEEDE